MTCFDNTLPAGRDRVLFYYPGMQLLGILSTERRGDISNV